MQRLDPNEPNSIQVNLKMSSTQKQMLDILSSNIGQSALIRSLIEKEWKSQEEQSKKEKTNGKR